MRYEDKEQEAVIEWASWHRTSGGHLISNHLIAIPNEGKRSGRTGKAMKRRGLIPGASDLFLALPAGTMHGLFIEMKKQRQHFRSESEKDAAFTKEQRDFQLLMRCMNYEVACCYGADEAIKRIQTYLGLCKDC